MLIQLLLFLLGLLLFLIFSEYEFQTFRLIIIFLMDGNGVSMHYFFSECLCVHCICNPWAILCSMWFVFYCCFIFFLLPFNIHCDLLFFVAAIFGKTCKEKKITDIIQTLYYRVVMGKYPGIFGIYGYFRFFIPRKRKFKKFLFLLLN